ncbi:hypothetical protein ASJ79_20055 [Mycobacterium sp. NAZ190054]|nr:hypothetical protein ASJ79_20055 [Mycobacterium sp. NAZ190054]
MVDAAPPFTDVIRSRRSARKFLPTPMSAADTRGVLEDALGRTAASQRTNDPRARLVGLPTMITSAS